jgi:glycosyltransferase involved in cell wall biosynthesis
MKNPLRIQSAIKSPLMQSTKPEISVVITTYNIEEYVERAICSVLDQAFPSLEIIVVDDGSSDETIKKVSKLLKGEPRCKIIMQANAGPGPARNAGLKQASGRFILYLDGDDWLAPRALEKLYASAVENKSEIVLSNRRRYWDRSGLYTSKPMFLKVKAGSIKDVPEVMKIMAIHGKLFERKFLLQKEIYFPSGMSSEDFVFSYKAYSLAERVSVITDVTYFYRKRQGSNVSLTQARLTEFNLSSRFKQIEMTLEIVENSKLRERLPNVRFEYVEFETRLMRHVSKLTEEKDIELRNWAFEKIGEFLKKHESLALSVVKAETSSIYKAIIAANFELATRLLISREAKASTFNET